MERRCRGACVKRRRNAQRTAANSLDKLAGLTPPTGCIPLGTICRQRPSRAAAGTTGMISHLPRQSPRKNSNARKTAPLPATIAKFWFVSGTAERSPIRRRAGEFLSDFFQGFRQVVVMRFDPQQPYNDLPLLPPAGELEPRAVLKKCVAANRALAELKGAGDLIPNQAILINAIPLQEAKLSSEIENIVTTQDALFQAAIDEGRNTDLPTRGGLTLSHRLASWQRGFKARASPFETPSRLSG